MPVAISSSAIDRRPQRRASREITPATCVPSNPASASAAPFRQHSTATLLLEQGVDLVVIKELLGHAHIGVTAGVYAHVRLRLQRQAVDILDNALRPGPCR